MPQTRFVTKKALALGLKPIVVVNKVDKPGARPTTVINAAFDLFDKLGATDEQLDFPGGLRLRPERLVDRWRRRAGEQWGPDMSAAVRHHPAHVPAHQGDPAGAAAAADFGAGLQTFVGRIGVGRVNAGTIARAWTCW